MTWSPTTCRRWLVQAQAAQTLAGSDNVRAREAMRAVEDAGRTALVEMRRLLGVIRADEPVDTPGNRALQPQLEDLPGLVQLVREAGLPASYVIGLLAGPGRGERAAATAVAAGSGR
jgi:Histidine kinase